MADGVTDSAFDAHETCSCDHGFASRDSLGNPSCVRPTAIMYCYVMIAAAGAALLAWHFELHRCLPRQARITRKSGIRLRFMVSARCESACAFSIPSSYVRTYARRNRHRGIILYIRKADAYFVPGTRHQNSHVDLLCINLSVNVNAV